MSGAKKRAVLKKMFLFCIPIALFIAVLLLMILRITVNDLTSRTRLVTTALFI